MEKGAAGLRIIAVTKLISACLLIILGCGLLHTLHSVTGDSLQATLKWLHLGPGHRLIETGISKVTSIDPHTLRELDVGTFLYAFLYIIEGTGLLCRKHWAEYLTIIATGTFLPLEGYELHKGVTAVKLAVLFVNLLIFFYLLYQLRVRHRTRFAVAAPPETIVPHTE